MFFSQLIQVHWDADDSSDFELVEGYEEFWAEVFRAHERALQRLSTGNSQWREAKRMLSDHGWADMAYFRKKENWVYETILEIIEDSVLTMRDDEDMQFRNCMWMMENNLRDDLIYNSQFPHQSLKIFVLLPSPAKAERYLYNYSSGRGRIYFLAIHFPTVFPRRGTWPNASPVASRLLKQYFRHEIVNNVDEIRRITFASPDTISDREINEGVGCMEQESWNRLIKIYVILFRESGTAWEDYLDYLREKGVWID